jgi:tRNA G18 (ribose-2'-O)-methylase SpoU
MEAQYLSSYSPDGSTLCLSGYAPDGSAKALCLSSYSPDGSTLCLSGYSPDGSTLCLSGYSPDGSALNKALCLSGYSPDGRPLNIRNEYRTMSPEDIKQTVLDNSLPYVIMAMNLKDCHNIGNIIRTSNLCGARKVIIFGRRKYNAKGSVGAHNYTEIDRIDAIPNADRINFDDEISQVNADIMIDARLFVEYINSNNYLPVFIEQDRFSKLATSRNITNIIQRAKEINKITCFILGNEGFGIPKNILDTRPQFELSYTLELKQMGSIRSHNVANCCAILSYKVMECFDDI